MKLLLTAASAIGTVADPVSVGPSRTSLAVPAVGSVDGPIAAVGPTRTSLAVPAVGSVDGPIAAVGPTRTSLAVPAVGSVDDPITAKAVSPSRTSLTAPAMGSVDGVGTDKAVGPSRTSLAAPAMGSVDGVGKDKAVGPSRTSLAAPAMGSVDGPIAAKAVGPSKTSLSDRAMIRIAEAYAAIQYNWDSSCSDSEFGNDHDDNYKQRRKYLLIDLDNGAREGKSTLVQTKPKRVKKLLKKGGQKSKGRKQSVSVLSDAKKSEGLVISDQQQEEILPRSDCFKCTTRSKQTNGKCLSPVEKVTDRSFREEIGDHQGIQQFPGILPNKVVLSDVGNYSCQEQRNPEKTQDKNNNLETVPHGEQHDLMESKTTCVIVLSDSDDEMDEFGNTESGDVAGSSEMPDESGRQGLLEGTTAVTVYHGEQLNFTERKEATTRPNELYSDDVFAIEPNESCDFEIDLPDCNTVRTLDMIHPGQLPHGARTLPASSDAATDGLDEGFSSEEETIVKIELQSDVNDPKANQTVMKERSFETQNSSLEWPVMTSSEGATVHDDISTSVCGAIHKPEQAPIQNLISACSRSISCSSEEQNISLDKIMRTAKVIQASGHRDEMSSLEEGLPFAGSGSGQRINQTQTEDVHKLLRADPSIGVSSDPLSVFSDHTTEETCYEAPQTAQSCDKCQLNFESADLLLKHFSKVHRKEGKTFGKQKRNTHHFPHASSSLNELHWSAVIKKGCQTLQNAQSCDKSESTSSSPEMLQKHSAKVEETGIFKPKRIHNCTICGEVNMSSQALHKHLLMHAGITPFDCDICGKAFTSASDLRQHLCIPQKKIKNQEYECNECGMTFAKYAALMYHKTLKHQDECRHDCKVCGKTFPTAVRLKYHMLVHSQKKDFHCTICEKSFKCKRYLDSHSYSHSQDRPFACSVCDKRFKRKQSRHTHEMKHL